jgi:K+-sensing histidine kinase KdpD
VALFAFLATALATGQLSARTRRLQAEAIQGRTETEKLHRVSQSLWECDSAEIIIQRLPGALLDILGLQGVAVYDQGTDRIWRSGERGEEIAAAELRAVAASGNDFQNPDSALAIAAVHGGAQFTGSIGIKGAAVSSLLLQAIAEAFENAIARAQAAERAKEVELAHRADEFRAAVFDALAHEATGPLGTIEIATTMLTDRPDDTAHQHEILNIISAEVTRLRRWIGEMIQTSGAESGQLVLNKAPHNVRDLAMAAVQTLGHRTSGRQISMDFDKTLLLVECDSEIIRRVLHLLLDNGMKYSPSGSTVAMSSTLIKDPGMIVLSVADAGPGIPEDEQTRIFERHYRGSHNRSRVPGTGLGLASAKYLVESHGGRIWVTNRPEGGAAFHFSLPAGKEVVA